MNIVIIYFITYQYETITQIEFQKPRFGTFIETKNIKKYKTEKLITFKKKFYTLC
jgi:hypothetical protein